MILVSSGWRKKVKIVEDYLSSKTLIPEPFGLRVAYFEKMKLSHNKNDQFRSDGVGGIDQDEVRHGNG